MIADGDGIAIGGSGFETAFGLEGGFGVAEIFQMDFGAREAFGESTESGFHGGGDGGDRGIGDGGLGMDFDFHAGLL